MINRTGSNPALRPGEGSLTPWSNSLKPGVHPAMTIALKRPYPAIADKPAVEEARRA
jgi:hypothetical protein